MEFITKHLGVKIVAVILAFFLWVHVVTNKTYEYTVEVPFNVVDVPDDLLLVSDISDKCEIRVRGTGKQLLRFLWEMEDLRFSASNYSTGLYVVDLTPGDLLVNQEYMTEIMEVISPKKLRLSFEERFDKVVPVVPDVKVAPALGYLTEGDLIVTPESISVSGPKRVVRKMKKLRTEHLDFVDIRSSLHEQVRLSFADSAYLTLSDSSVLIEQSIVQLSERTFTGIPVIVRHGESHAGYTIAPDSISVTVEIPPSLLDSVTADQFTASIDIAKALPGSTYVTPRISIPKGLHLVDVKPKEIQVEVPRR